EAKSRPRTSPETASDLRFRLVVGELGDLRTLSSADRTNAPDTGCTGTCHPLQRLDRPTAVRTQRTVVSEVVNCWNTAASTCVPAWRRGRTETPTAPSATAWTSSAPHAAASRSRTLGQRPRMPPPATTGPGRVGAR